MQVHAVKEWKIYRWLTSKDSVVCLAEAELKAVNRRLPWRQRWLQMPRMLLMLQPDGRIEPLPPCWLMPRTPPPRHYVVPRRSSPSGLLPPRSGSGNFCHPPRVHCSPETVPTHRTAGDVTRKDTSSPVLPAMLMMMMRSAAGSRPLESRHPARPPPGPPTTMMTATSIKTTTTTTTTTPLSGKPLHPRTSSDDGTAGGTWGACYRWWTWNSSLGGDAARDDRLAGDAFIAGDSDRFSRVHLYYGRGSFMTRVWGSTTLNSRRGERYRCHGPHETAKRSTCVRARRR